MLKRWHSCLVASGRDAAQANGSPVFVNSVVVNMNKLLDYIPVIEHLLQLQSESETLQAYVGRAKQLLHLRSALSPRPLLVNELARRLERAGYTLDWLRQRIGVLRDRFAEPNGFLGIEDIRSKLQETRKSIALVLDTIDQRLPTTDSIAGVSLDALLDEFHDPTLFFRAADATLVGLHSDIFGTPSGTVRNSDEGADPAAWTYPIAYFSPSKTYHVYPGAGIAVLPDTDLLRVRMWCNLAHELGHIAVERDTQKSKTGSVSFSAGAHLDSLVRRVRNSITNASAAISLEPWQKKAAHSSPPQEWHRHTHELLADAIATWVMGPSAAMALLGTVCFDESAELKKIRHKRKQLAVGLNTLSHFDDDDLAASVQWSVQASHPPMALRIAHMRELLTLLCPAARSLHDILLQWYPSYVDITPMQDVALRHWFAAVEDLAKASLAYCRAAIKCSPYNDTFRTRVDAEILADANSVSDSPRYVLAAAWQHRLGQMTMAINAVDKYPLEQGQPFAQELLATPTPTATTFVLLRLIRIAEKHFQPHDSD